MGTDANISHQAVTELYAILSEFYKQPTEEWYENIRSGAVEKELNRLMMESGLDLPPVHLDSIFPSFSSMKQDYNDIFSGVGGDAAPPVESVYKVWTTDPTAELSIAGSKGYMFGDSAIHMRYLFNQYGLEIPSDYEVMPDHLTLLLEFLVFLLERESYPVIAQFMKDHFDWLGDFITNLGERQDTFFLQVTELLVTIVDRHEKAISGSITAEK